MYKLKPEERAKVIKAIKDHELDIEMNKWPAALKQEYERKLKSLKMMKEAYSWKEAKFHSKLGTLRHEFKRRGSLIHFNSKFAPNPNSYHRFGGHRGGG